MTAQNTMTTQLKRTPLYEQHKALGARMVDFGGWGSGRKKLYCK